MKKQNASLIAKLLNKNSQPAEVGTERIVMRDARELVPNPKNKAYSQNDIEQLASMIQMTQSIEPAIVRQLDDGRYMLMSGYRRCQAQIYRYDQGWLDDPMLPTITRDYVNAY